RDARALQLQSSRLRVALFKNIQSESAEERQAALEKIIQVVKSFVRVARSPYSVSSVEAPATPPSPAIPPHFYPAPSVKYDDETDHANLAHDSLAYDDNCGANDDSANLRYYLLSMLRLAYTCPFGDVRQAFRAFLQMMNDSRVMFAPRPNHLSPSIFISLNDIFSLEPSVHRAFISYPRPEHYTISPWSQEDVAVETPKPDNPNKPRFEDYAYTGGRASDEYVRQMMTKTFMDEGRLANVFRVMTFFPTFYEIYSNAYIKAMRTSIGPLSRTWKWYLGIVAAANHQCQYLVSLLRLEYLQAGGDAAWLRGIDACPPKLQHIASLILKMSRRPWQLTSEDITRLMSSRSGVHNEVWSKGELVQAIVVIATFLGLSSFVLGCGIAPELDMRGGYHFLGHEDDHVEGVESELDMRLPWSPGKDKNEGMARAAASMATGWHDSSIVGDDEQRQLFSSDNGYGLGVSFDCDASENKTNELVNKLRSMNGSSTSTLKGELLESLEKLRLGNEHVQQAAPAEHDHHTQTMNLVYEDLTRFMDPSARQIPFDDDDDDDDGGSIYHMNEMMSGDYCWEDFGSDLVNQYLPDLGDDLNEEFTEALSITDWTIFHHTSDTNIDTSPFRRAIWYQTQRLLGMTKDDYNYEDITTYLSDRNKEYITKLCLRPFEIRLSDWNNIGLSLRPEEKCHVNLLVASAKKQALLCYGLNVISQA
ncbi:PA26 p53-induced protein-domain-containing protein, partial [Dichotomocladium elegans]